MDNTMKRYRDALEDIKANLEDCQTELDENGECICNLYPCWRFTAIDALEHMLGMSPTKINLTLRDWIRFNFQNDNCSCNLGDIYVKVFRKFSYKTEDMIMDVLMKVEDAEALFGDYNLFCTKISKSNLTDYHALCVLIYKPE